MKTTMTEVTEPLCIWAIPKHEYQIEADPHSLPFNYEFRRKGHTPYQDGSTLVHTVDVTLVVPAGIDLLEKAIETLKSEIQKTRAEAQVQVEKLEKQIEGLLMLEHKDDLTGQVI